MKILVLLGVLLGVFVVGSNFIYREINIRNENLIKSENQEFKVEIEPTLELPSPTNTLKPVRKFIPKKQFEVPFTSQAPYGNWANTFFQDGCEEASVLMVMCILDNNLECETESNKIIPSYTNSQLISMGEWQTVRFENGVDTSTQDTLQRLVREYYKSEIGQVVDVSSIEDLLNGIEEGNIYIVPTDGRLLLNPNFTNGGPERHNLVVLGFDRDEGVFITNDPGTRNGMGYKYKFEVLWNAIGDYPTGNHAKINEREKKVIEFKV